MAIVKKTLMAGAAGLVALGILVGCGDSDDAPADAGGGAATSAVTGPESADDERGEAPDDAVSDRPGGPDGDRYGQGQRQGQNGAQ